MKDKVFLSLPVLTTAGLEMLDETQGEKRKSVKSQIPHKKITFTASLPHLSAEITDEPSLQATSPTSPPVFKSRPSYC